MAQAGRQTGQVIKKRKKALSATASGSNIPMNLFKKTEVCTSLSIITFLQFFTPTHIPQIDTLGQLSQTETSA